MDLAFSDGTYLSDLKAKDHHGFGLSPRGQGDAKGLSTNQWNNIEADLGKVAAGKTVKRILVGYDKPSGPADFRGWIDDIRISKATDTPTPPRSKTASQAPVGPGDHHPRHELHRRFLPGQQLPGDRSTARLQLLDPGHQRRLALLAVRLRQGQQRPEQAGDPGLLDQPRAEPVDG